MGPERAFFPFESSRWQRHPTKPLRRAQAIGALRASVRTCEVCSRTSTRASEFAYLYILPLIFSRRLRIQRSEVRTRMHARHHIPSLPAWYERCGRRAGKAKTSFQRASRDAAATASHSCPHALPQHYARSCSGRCTSSAGKHQCTALPLKLACVRIPRVSLGAGKKGISTNIIIAVVVVIVVSVISSASPPQAFRNILLRNKQPLRRTPS